MKVKQLRILFEDMKEGDIVENRDERAYFILRLIKCNCSCDCKRVRRMKVMFIDCMNKQTFTDESERFKGRRQIIRIMEVKNENSEN